jgi:hypothetical protein
MHVVDRFRRDLYYLSRKNLIYYVKDLQHRQKCESTRQGRSSDQRAQGAQGAQEARCSSDLTPQKSKQLQAAENTHIIN